MSDFAHREQYAVGAAWRTSTVPVHRYKMAGYTHRQTAEFVRLAHSVLPDEWGMGNGGCLASTRPLRQLQEQLDAAGRIRKPHGFWWWGTGPIFKAYNHLKAISVIVLVSRCPMRYRKLPLPADPLEKPSSTKCTRAAAELVNLASPVDDTHVSVPQQMMQGLLSGALTR